MSKYSLVPSLSHALAYTVFDLLTRASERSNSHFLLFSAVTGQRSNIHEYERETGDKARASIQLGENILTWVVKYYPHNAKN